MDRFMEIFTLLTGVIYIVLEIRQKNFMWVVGVVTSIAAIYTFMCQHLYASVALNAYYFCMKGRWKAGVDVREWGYAG